MTTHFSDKLLLARWALHQLGVADFDRLAMLLTTVKLSLLPPLT